MGHHQYGLPCPVDGGKQPQQLVGGAAVQRAGRLIRQQQLRLGDDGPGHCRPLLLPAGDLIGVLLQKLRQSQLPGNRQQPRPHILVRHSHQHQRQIDVVLQRKCVQQVELLEHKTQVVPAEGRRVPLPYLAQFMAVQPHRTRRGLVQRRQNVQQRGLAAAGLTHDSDILALLHGEADIPQRLYTAAAQPRGVYLPQPAYFQNTHSHSTSLSTRPL